MSKNDHPFYKVVSQAEEYMLAGHIVHQKFTCANCGSRQTMEEPNVFFKTGKCEECNYITDIEVQGCNFLLVTRSQLF